MGTFEQPLMLPVMEVSGLALSSVVVSNQLEHARGRGTSHIGQDNPLEFGDRSILPSVTRVFRTNQHLCVYVESYLAKADVKPSGPQAAEEKAAPSSVALVFFRGGIKTSEAGPFAGKWVSRDHKVKHFVEIPLVNFPPGRYWTQVNVLDSARGRVAFARLPLAIMIPPPRLPTKAGTGGH